MQAASDVGQLGGADAGSVPAIAEAQRPAQGGVAVAADPYGRATGGDGRHSERGGAQRRELPVEVGRAEVASTEETYEALADGRGVCLLAAGNAPLITLGGVTTRPVNGLSTSRLALAWHRGDTRPLVLDYARAGRQATRRHLSAEQQAQRTGPETALSYPGTHDEGVSEL